VFRCDDYGNRCENLSAGLPQDDYVVVMREDPKNPNVLYAGMERGLQVSLDAGKSWHDLRLNLPRVSVRDIKVHPRENDLIVATHGRGVWILDDIAPIQNLADAMATDVALFDVHRATRWENWDKDSNLGSSTWLGENPPAGAMINYYLRADSPATGTPAITITIADAAGTTVGVIRDRGRAGVNRTLWDMSWGSAATAAPAGGRGGGRGGRGGGGQVPALPGKYTVTLSAAGKTISKPLELRGDPDVNLPMADYQAQFEAAKKARELAIRASQLVTTVDDLTQQVTTAEAQARKAGMANIDQVLEQAGTAKAQLIALMDKLRRPQPAMGYRMYPRLTEDVGTTLGGIAGPQARPTSGQMTVLGELEADATARQQELNKIIDGSIAALNKMLGDQPKVIVPRQGGGR
jgi:hypothetical protein